MAITHQETKDLAPYIYREREREREVEVDMNLQACPRDMSPTLALALASELFKLFNYNLASSYMFKICSYNKLFVFLNVEVGLTICINLQFIIKNYVDIFNYVATLFSY